MFLRFRCHWFINLEISRWSCSAGIPSDVLLPFVGPGYCQVIESFSCGLGNVHGRLYVTSKYALFSGWRNTKVSKPIADAKT